MWYSYRFRAYPDKDISVEIERQIDIHRQGYNQVLHEYNNLDDERVGTAYGHQKLIKKWKSDWRLSGFERRSCSFDQTSVSEPASSQLG